MMMMIIIMTMTTIDNNNNNHNTQSNKTFFIYMLRHFHGSPMMLITIIYSRYKVLRCVPTNNEIPAGTEQ